MTPTIFLESYLLRKYTGLLTVALTNGEVYIKRSTVFYGHRDHLAMVGNRWVQIK